MSVTASGGAPSLGEAEAAEGDRAREAALAHPLTQAALAAFPGAEIVEIRPPGGAEAALEAPDEEWDPFDA
jgi:DNA polymerase-3 subunit gamma/tau